MIIFPEVSPGVFDVIYDNGLTIGQIFMAEDGYYVYWPDQRGGFWTAYGMTTIGNKLSEMNADWDQEINKFLDFGKEES